MGIDLIGDVKALKADKVYIIGTHKRWPYIDSVSVKNGHFQYSHNKVEESIIVKIYYLDANKNKHFFNFQGLDQDVLLGQCLLENAKIRIKGDIYSQTLIGGRENELFKLSLKQNPNIDEAVFDGNRGIKNLKYIIQNPNSTFLLQELSNAKVLMNRAELEKQYNLFSPELKISRTGREINTYLAELSAVNKQKIDDSFVYSDSSGKRIQLTKFFEKDKLTLYIFWASWCIPCRQEIPELKIFHNKYKNRITLVSLSIDSDLGRWRNALTDEKMPWLNLADFSSSLGEIKNRFLINSIPDMILVNDKGEKLLTERNMSISRIESYILNSNNAL